MNTLGCGPNGCLSCECNENSVKLAKPFLNHYEVSDLGSITANVGTVMTTLAESGSPELQQAIAKAEYEASIVSVDYVGLDPNYTLNWAIELKNFGDHDDPKVKDVLDKIRQMRKERLKYLQTPPCGKKYDEGEVQAFLCGKTNAVPKLHPDFCLLDIIMPLVNIAVNAFLPGLGAAVSAGLSSIVGALGPVGALVVQAGQAVAQVVSPIVNAVAPIVDGVVQAAGPIIEAGGEIVDAVGGFVGDAVKPVQEFLDQVDIDLPNIPKGSSSQPKPKRDWTPDEAHAIEGEVVAITSLLAGMSYTLGQFTSSPRGKKLLTDWIARDLEKNLKLKTVQKFFGFIPDEQGRDDVYLGANYRGSYYLNLGLGITKRSFSQDEKKSAIYAFSSLLVKNISVGRELLQSIGISGAGVRNTMNRSGFNGLNQIVHEGSYMIVITTHDNCGFKYQCIRQKANEQGLIDSLLVPYFSHRVVLAYYDSEIIRDKDGNYIKEIVKYPPFFHVEDGLGSYSMYGKTIEAIIQKSLMDLTLARLRVHQPRTYNTVVEQYPIFGSPVSLGGSNQKALLGILALGAGALALGIAKRKRS